MKIFLCVAALLFATTLFGQHSINFSIKNETGEPLAGASILILSLKKGASTDTSGFVEFKNLAAGKYVFRVSYTELEQKEETIVIPYDGKQPNEIFLKQAEHEEAEEIIIQSTRSTRTIQNIPTRVEFIAGEELDEKANMKPGDIRMVLNESTGIQTQQTSATSANASIRIQGLDGRYTQLLKDGFPLYAGFSNGLGLLQTPPLDLKQFEVIKGSASTLFGGGAIAGLVNLISKTPTDERELKFHFDGTSAGGLNTSGFFGQRFGKTGLTLFVSRNSNAAFDPSTTGLTAIPEFERYTINPKLYYYFNEKTQVSAGVNLSFEDRTGGDIAFIKNRKPSGYFENNNTDRFSSQFSFEHRFGKSSHLSIKNSLSRFKRVITIPSYSFNGTQDATFTELTYALHDEKIEWIGGVNLVTDHFREVQTTSTPLRDYEQLTFGAFLQQNWKINNVVHLETGIRGDQVKDYGFAFLSRLAVLFKINPQWSSRIGGGLGYKTPTIFTEESERLLYRDVLPIDEDVNRLERSYGFNADINYKSTFGDGELHFSINQLFFYTRIADPLLLQPGTGNYQFVNADGHIDTRGIETNVRLGYQDFKLFLGYTFTDAFLHQGSSKSVSFLTPKHRLNSVLLYEVEE